MALKYSKVDEVTSANYAVFVERAIELQLPVNERVTVKVSSRDKDIALQIAAANGHAEIATLRLAKGAHRRSTAAVGSSPLHFAGYNGHARLIRLLLEAGADVTALEKDKNTVVHFVAQKGQIGFLQELLTAVPKLDIKSAKPLGRNSPSLCHQKWPF